MNIINIALLFILSAFDLMQMIKGIVTFKKSLAQRLKNRLLENIESSFKKSWSKCKKVR